MPTTARPNTARPKARKLSNRHRPMWRDSFIDKTTFERRPLPRETANTAIRNITWHGGGGSFMCFDYPIRLPRITLIDGPYTGAAA